MMSVPILGPCPIKSDWIMDGEPVASHCLVERCENHDSYYWSCTPGMFRWEYDCDETVVLLSGEISLMNVRAAQFVLNLRAGDSIVFQRGDIWIWTVHETVTKFATFVHPLPRIARFWLQMKRFLLRPVAQEVKA